jgi:hypothetical protein
MFENARTLLQVARVLDIAAINKCTTIGEFDELFIARVCVT